MAASVPQFASLYVGDLHPDVTEAMLYEIFNAVGPVASIRVCRDSISRRSLGYAYVNFHGVSDAERALDALNYSSIKGRACRIMWSQRDPSLRKSGVGNVFVKNLDRSIDNKALYDTFSLFGNILSCKVAADSSGKSRGYGFVHYETEEAAKQAIERVNGMQIGEKTVHVSAFSKRGDREKPEIVNFTNLYIKNYPEEWDEKTILSTFEAYGKITSHCIMQGKGSGTGFAFVNYENTEAARAAVAELHGKEMRSPEQIAKDKEDSKEPESDRDGHPFNQLYVQRAQNKSERAAELRQKYATAETGKQSQQGVNLYIKNLDEGCTDDSLRALFEPFGQITSVVAMKDDKGNCKGFGFVCFTSPDDATKAVTEMHLKVVKGKPLYVGLAEKREARQERLRQRYSPAMPGAGKGKGPGFPGGPGGKGGGPDMGGPQMYGGQQMGMGGPMGGMGMRPGMPNQNMMYPGMMYPGMQPMMKGGPPQMMGPRPGMMTPQMMGMMGKGGPMGGPQMMGKGNMPGMMGPGMMGMGMMRPPMPGPGQMPGAAGMRPAMPGAAGPGMPATPQPQPQQQVQPGGPPQQSAGAQPLTASVLANAAPGVQKQMLGEKLYPCIAKLQPELAGKITGMMLEMDNSELLMLLESEQQLRNKVNEALQVLQSSGGRS